MKWPTASNNPVLVLSLIVCVALFVSSFLILTPRFGTQWGVSRQHLWCCCCILQLRLEMLVGIETFRVPAFDSIQISLN